MSATVESSAQDGCPFTVPPFDPGSYKGAPRYYWWSWHPNYPYWSKSCWCGNTEAEAYEKLNSDMAIGMRLYHNKLIREDATGMTEVADVPCKEMDVWRKIKEQHERKAGGLA